MQIAPFGAFYVGRHGVIAQVGVNLCREEFVDGKSQGALPIYLRRMVVSEGKQPRRQRDIVGQLPQQLELC